MDCATPCSRLFALACLLALAPGALAAPLYSVRVDDRSSGFPVVVGSDSGTTEAAINIAFDNNGGGSSSAQAQAAAGRLRAAVSARSTGIGINAFHNEASVRGTASLLLDDVVFSGPASTVAAAFSVDLDGGSSSSNAVNEGFLAEVAGDLDGRRVLFDSYNQTNGTVSRRLTSTVIEVPTGTPLTLALSLDLFAAVFSVRNESEFVSGNFFDTLQFPTTGAVFDLPTGFTVNSAGGGIVDNRFAAGSSVAAPAPPAVALLAAGLLGLAVQRRLAGQAAGLSAA